MNTQTGNFVLGAWCIMMGTAAALDAAEPRFTTLQMDANDEMSLGFDTAPGAILQLQASSDLVSWRPLVTLQTSGSNQHTDSATRFLPRRFYRLTTLAGTGHVTGDHLPTEAGGVVIHPINHATFVLQWQGQMIYVDPVGGALWFGGLPKADLILVTHRHGDHFDNATLAAVKSTAAELVVPPSVYNRLSAGLKGGARVLANGGGASLLGLEVAAVPAYNLTSNFHPKGEGNGYVLTIGGRRIYISGDTEDTPEMRALRDIEVAFVCMNQPYTMKIGQAVSAVRAFQPRIVYPYHHSDTDIARFKQQLGQDLPIEVRLRTWY